jgi:hypothetical protein
VRQKRTISILISNLEGREPINGKGVGFGVFTAVVMRLDIFKR